MELVDAHLHLSQVSGLEEVLKMSRERGMRLFAASTDVADSTLNLRLRDDNPQVVACFAGVHPSEATSVPPSTELDGLVERADGVGEIGLDPGYSEIGVGTSQNKTFLAQLEMCEKKGKPLQLHSRGAERQVLDVLSSFRVESVLLHWFEGQDQLSEASSKGYFVSLGPALLYSKKLQRIALRYPRDLVLTESDAPVMFKQIGDQASGPILIASVVFTLAELWGSDYEEIAITTSENAERFIRRSKG